MKIIKKILYLHLLICFNYCLIHNINIQFNEIENKLYSFKLTNKQDKTLVLMSSQILQQYSDKIPTLWKNILQIFPMSYIIHQHKSETKKKNKNKYINNNSNNNNYNKNNNKTNIHWTNKQEKIVLDLLKIINIITINKKVMIPIMQNKKYNPICYNNTLIYMNSYISLEIFLIIFLIFCNYIIEVKQIILINNDLSEWQKETFQLFKIKIILIAVTDNKKDLL